MPRRRKTPAIRSKEDRPQKPSLLTPDGKPFKVQQSWKTDDAYEIQLRQVRAASETMAIVPPPRRAELFRNYEVRGAHDTYTVELRSLTARVNTCTCQDFQKNFLGTCKHIEYLLQKLGNVREESPFYEIFLDHATCQARLLRPARSNLAVARQLALFFGKNGVLRAETEVSKLLAFVDNLPEGVRAAIRVSAEIRQLAERQEEQRRMQKLREIVEAQLTKSHGALPFLKERLYDYQMEGVLHLAFKGRAILADDMGLGKTVQAVAASAVMRELLGVRRVLVVSPTSLKQEWEEQIHKFTAFSCEPVFGSRPQRLAFYRSTDAFFVLMNYEQVVRDAKEIMELLKPDLLILDEAQRIKNWTTQTARTLKGMVTPYVFVLTGTPLENRIDDIYSLAEIVDPTIFGSLFRFNRRYYKFDETGKLCGMQNLSELHARLAPIMLRRRKSEVALELPSRSDRNLFVRMTVEQRKRYAEAEYQLQIIVNRMKRRPLTQEDFQRMQLFLATMRMLCDSCYILDPEVTDAPKLDELMILLQQSLENEPTRKIIVFSEWVRMLDLLKERLECAGLLYMEHTGAVPQKKRREQLLRFKTDPDIHLLLCSEAGGTGLNLQQANLVINLDLPWNPAKLEQRIARAWRNRQQHPVEVINLVAENTIEHKMLATLKFKSGLAEVVLDGTGEAARFEDLNAKETFAKRLQELLSAPQTQPKPSFAERVRQSHARLSQVFSMEGANGGRLLVGVGRATDEQLQKLGEGDTQAVVLSEEMMQQLQKLSELGVILFNKNKLECIFKGDGQAEAPAAPDPEETRRMELARACLATAERPLKMAKVLCGNDFADEAPAAIWKASAVLERAVFLRLYGEPEASAETPLEPEAVTKLLDDAQLDDATRRFLELSHDHLNAKEPTLVAQCETAMAAIRQWIECLQPDCA